MKLTSEALNCLYEWFDHYTRGEVSELFENDLRGYREYLDEEENVDIISSYQSSGIFDD
jgi:hypothetical protein